jgi:MFS family permease
VAGLLLLPQTAGFALGGAVAGRLQRRVRPSRILLGANLTSCVGYLALVTLHAAPWQVAGVTLLSGAGNGLAFAVLPTVVMAAVPPAQTGAATGLNANVRLIGGAIGGQLLAAVSVGFGAGALLPTEHGYTWAFAVLAGFATFGALAGLLVPTDLGAGSATSAPVWDGDPVSAPPPGAPGLPPVSRSSAGRPRATTLPATAATRAGGSPAATAVPRSSRRPRP